MEVNPVLSARLLFQWTFNGLFQCPLQWTFNMFVFMGFNFLISFFLLFEPRCINMVFLFKLELTYLKSEISSFESESKLKQNEILVKHTEVAGNWLFYLLVVCKQLTHFDLPEKKKG